MFCFVTENKTIMSFRENANKMPLGRPNPQGSKTSTGSSLLNPSYLRGTEDDPADDYEAFSTYFANFSSPATAAAVSTAVANITSSLKRDISRSDDDSNGE